MPRCNNLRMLSLLDSRHIYLLLVLRYDITNSRLLL
jgi:hypothetical protein